MTNQKKYDLDEDLESIDLTEQIKDATWIPAKRNPKNAGRKKIGRRVSIILPEETIERLLKISQKKGLGYQTLARLYVVEKTNEESEKILKAG